MMFGHGYLSRIFKVAAGVGCINAMLSGCSTIPWDGNPGHQEDRINEPLLTPTPGEYQDIQSSPAPENSLEHWMYTIDKLLNPTDNFTVEKIDYLSEDGQYNSAYLTLPAGDDPKPMVVVFPILSGTPFVSELLSRELARRDYAVLRIQGRALEPDKAETFVAVMNKFRYAIVDARALMDWAKEHPQIDGENIAAAGVSLGGILSSTLMGIDEDIDAGVFMVAGSGLAELLYDSEQKALVKFKENMIELFNLKSREEFIELVQPHSSFVDPSTYAGSLDPCRTYVISANMDKIIPKERTEELWERLGKPKWSTVTSGHSTFAIYFYWATKRTASHFDRVIKDKVCERDIPPPSQPAPSISK
jgi:dienelactone hydrolase